MKTNNAVNLFRNFLIASWEVFTKFNQNLSEEDIEDRRDNWMQANWELLVESSVIGSNEFLKIYGDGADFYGSSSRICFPNAIPTHRIFCKIKSGIICKDIFTGREVKEKEIEKMTFERFTTLTEDKKYFDAPPFDYVILSPLKEVEIILVSVNDVCFDIVKI